MAPQLTASMLRELASHVVFPVNTSGPLLLVLMNRSVDPTHAPVSMEVLMGTTFPHLWARTTSVRQAYVKILEQTLSGQMVTCCGTDRGVVPLAPVAPSTHHHGSTYNCLLPQPIILRSESVGMESNTKIPQYNSWNFL